MFRLIFMIAYKETVHASCYESLSVQWFRRRTKLSRFLLCSFLSYFCRGQALDASWLIPHFYPNGKYLIVEITDKVSMPSRAYTSFLRYPFKNLSFMRFPEPVFAGIYQNILTTAVFRAC